MNVRGKVEKEKYDIVNLMDVSLKEINEKELTMNPFMKQALIELQQSGMVKRETRIKDKDKGGISIYYTLVSEVPTNKDYYKGEIKSIRKRKFRKQPKVKVEDYEKRFDKISDDLLDFNNIDDLKITTMVLIEKLCPVTIPEMLEYFKNVFNVDLEYDRLKRVVTNLQRRDFISIDYDKRDGIVYDTWLPAKLTWKNYVEKAHIANISTKAKYVKNKIKEVLENEK